MEIDVLKEWIGVPSVVHGGQPVERSAVQTADLTRLRDEVRPELSRALTLDVRHRDAKAVDRRLAEHSNDLSALARTYLYRDARQLQEWKGILDLWIRDLRIPMWIYETVIIEAGGILEIDDGVNILVVRRLIIREGGTIRVRGNLKLDLESIQRTS